jgi:V/A-type H+-transporting ATPase subunit A
MIGTVSPAGGNFEEPVLQSTLSTVKTFLGLSPERAYKRFYPAVDILLSWSRYFDQLEDWYEKNAASGWVDQIRAMTALLKQGEAINRMMEVTGEEGVALEDFVTYQKSLFLDMVYLQQDAFDEVDASMSLVRQKKSFMLVRDLVNRPYKFADKTTARDYFTRLTGLYKNLNYSREDAPGYNDYVKQIHELAESNTQPTITATSQAK